MQYSVDLHPELLGLMQRQGGVFTGVQAQFFGHPPGQLQWLRTRRHPVLVSVRRGVYTWFEVWRAASAIQRHKLATAALALCVADDAVLSHESAAVHHELELLDPDLDVVHVTRRVTTGSRLEAGVMHHVAELLPQDVVAVLSGLDVTSVARTAVDVARRATTLAPAVTAFDSALRHGVDRADLYEVFGRCRSWSGIRNVAMALELADGRADNPGESWSRVVLIEQGLPPDDLQVPITDSQGFVGYADFGWEGVVGEFDGKGKYDLPVESEEQDVDPDERRRRALWREKLREERMRAEYEVVRWTFADLYSPRQLAARVRAAQERARRRGLRLGPTA